MILYYVLSFFKKGDGMDQFTDRHDSLKEATRLAAESAGFEGVVDDILTKVVHESIKRYQQKINVGVEDSVSDLIDFFKQKVTEEIFDSASSWKLANKEKEPIIFPRGCRYAYTRGKSTIFVIEESPKIRTITFEHGERYSLAMPYVIFMSHFNEGRFSGLYCGWANSSLETLNDLIYRPLLPNIHNHLLVCRGGHSPEVVGSFSKSTELAITEFWSSRFNDDLADRWNERKEVSHLLDPAERWVLESEEDMMFMLRLEFGVGKTIQSHIDLLTTNEEEPDESEFRHLLSERIDACTNTLFRKILRYFKKTKFEKHSPKDVTESLKDAIIESTGDFTDVIRSLNGEIDNLSVANERKHSFVKAGNFWTDYSP